MIVVSKHFGFVLVFKDKEQLSMAAKHLQGIVEEAQKGLIKPPYVYCYYNDEGMDEKTMQSELKDLKKRFK